jgi:predicted AAA+ superfamily ATPase
MAYERARFLNAHLKRQGKLWPVVGVVGLRQSGKTTMLRDQIQIENYVTLDDDDDLTAALAAPKIFIARHTLPLIIDEIQKAPKLFDTIKLMVDKKRVPGQFYITGSSQFSDRIGIRESLTGRIGLCQLFPMTLAEARQQPPLTSLPKLNSAPRFSWESLLQHAPKGGMPVPMFLRNENQVNDYWKGWLETSIYRDLANCFKKSYQPETSKSILRTMGRVMAEGELPTLSHFEIDSRRLRNYLEAMETIFLVRRISCHERGVGKDMWMFGDSGLARYYMGNSKTDQATLSLIRHTLWNETSALMGYLGESENRQYFKSARGTVIDWVWDNVPMKIVTSLKQRAFQERALRGAMDALEAKNGYLIAPIDRIEIPPRTGGVGVLPWSMWS